MPPRTPDRADGPAVPLDVPLAAGPAPLPRPVARPRTLASDLALVTTFAAFVVVCSVVPAVPLPFGVPLTLQTFAVVLAGLVLGPVRGALAVLLYLALGLAGLPVFAEGTGGVGVLGKASVGYLLSFPLLALVAGALALPAWRRRRPLPLLVVAGLVGTLLVNHPAGVAGLAVRLGTGWREALALDLAFVPGDAVKVVLAAVVATAVLRAFPDLRPGRRR
ncbi:biotin transporter BioY [Cellulomonas endophytica]|uniref:biotin transporter BioY n=1 Tax=Cellulomonas endophytica TaxID=2494735 RepID=UPI00101197AB|nr:biotin transporter BioY [Cellulomonas endophytica]